MKQFGWILLFISVATPAEATSIEMRRQLCQDAVSEFVNVHERFKAGLTLERYRKELEILAAGEDLDSDVQAMLLMGASIAEQYVKEGLTARDLEIDFLHPCVTSEKTSYQILTDWMREKLPPDHPYLEALEAQAPPESPKFMPDGTVRPQDYRALLGSGFEGTQNVNAYIRRSEGELIGCGFEFAHAFYDEIYALGAPVKLSGSLNILEHPSTLLAGLLKIKGEDIAILRESDGSPSMRVTTFEINTAYVTSSDKPLLDNAESFACEDPEYFCQIVFDWDKMAEALLTNTLGMAYRRKGGGTDVMIRIDLSQPEESGPDVLQFNECMLELINKIDANIDEP